MSKPHSMRDKVHRENRAEISKQHKAQCHEPWQLRAIKLQLLHPHYFSKCLAMKQLDHNNRAYAQGYFTQMSELGILKSIDFGMLTPYRITLLLRACRSYDRQCAKERLRAQQAAQDPGQAPRDQQEVGLDCHQELDTRRAQEDYLGLTGDFSSLEHRMVLAQPESLFASVMEGHGS